MPYYTDWVIFGNFLSIDLGNFELGFLTLLFLPATLRTALSAGSRERMQSGCPFCHSSSASLSISIFGDDDAAHAGRRESSQFQKVPRISNPIYKEYKLIIFEPYLLPHRWRYRGETFAR